MRIIEEIKYGVFGGNWWYFVDKITYDWWHSDIAGEEFKEYEAGKNNVKMIGFHGCNKSEDKSYCDIVFEDGLVERIYNVHSMGFKANA